MEEIKLKLSSNELDWIKHIADKYNITPNHLMHQLSFSLINLMVNGSIKDQTTVMNILDKYLTPENK